MIGASGGEALRRAGRRVGAFLALHGYSGSLSIVTNRKKEGGGRMGRETY